MEERDNERWLAKTLLLFHLRTRGSENTSGQLVFASYFETTPPLNAVDRTLYCISLRCATDEELDHTLHTRGLLTDKVEVVEWLSVVLFTLIVSVHHIVRSKY